VQRNLLSLRSKGLEPPVEVDAEAPGAGPEFPTQRVARERGEQLVGEREPDVEGQAAAALLQRSTRAGCGDTHEAPPRTER
jgi:hypothetical protein